MVEPDGSGCISKLWDPAPLPAPVLFTISALKVCSDLYSKSSQLGLKTLTCLNNLRDAPAMADIFGG